MFEAKSKPKSNLKPLDSIKSIDPTTFPPCRNVLSLHIKRAWYIARLYKTAFFAFPSNEYTPIDFGWQLSACNDYLEMDWFHGEQVPSEIEDGDAVDADGGDPEESDSDSDMVESDESESEDEEDMYF